MKDAEWIATCLEKNLIASSFVPDERIQRLRQYDRRIFDLSASISRNLVSSSTNASSNATSVSAITSPLRIQRDTAP